MQKKYKYILFNEIHSKNKTKKFECLTTRGDQKLGEVEWYRYWRQYCFFPEENVVFSKGCLDDISDFLSSIKNLRN